MNINNIISTPVLFRDIKSSYALCDPNGDIIRIFTTLESAKYMSTTVYKDAIIYEVIEYKSEIISNLGEV